MKKILCLLLTMNFLFTTVYAQADVEVEAEAAVLFDYENNRILWEKNPDQRFAIASTTKILTAILAIENKDMDVDVTISSKAAYSSYSSMNLKVGEKIQLKYLLHALLLESCNDAAVAIAEHVSGSESKFAELMNSKAKELGAVNSNFVTASGLDIGVDHYSTARDMAIITSYAMKNPTFRQIFSTREYGFSSSVKSYYYKSQNKLFDEFLECVGGKTGYTSKAKSSYIGVFEADGRKFICVVLRSSSDGKWEDARKMISYGLNNYFLRDVYVPEIDLGDNHILRLKNPILILLNGNEYDNIETEVVLSQEDEGLSGIIKFSVNGNAIQEQSFSSEDAEIISKEIKAGEVNGFIVKYIPL